ncbi:MAG TPA: hypothetical protein DC038_07010 [Clostridiales bacterium]|nr:hypothetical protein [Clostridiales bacterium]
MNKFDKADVNVKSIPEDVRGNNSKNGITISKSSNQIGISNAILSFIMYFSISTLAGSAVGSESADNIIHWGYLAAYLIFAVLFFYILKILSSFYFGIYENITLKNIVFAIVCAILVYLINYSLNLLVWQKIFIASYDILIVDFKSLIPLPILIYGCILGPIGEELVCRGYMLKGLRNKYSTTLALLLSSLVFAVIHLNIVQIMNALFMGIVFGLLYIKTGSIFSCILAHILNNSIAMFVMNYYPHNF